MVAALNNKIPSLTRAEVISQRLHDEIAATKPSLRQNRSGDATLAVAIIRCIIQSEGIDRPGHLFGIIGPATFSYGDSRKIILPNSGITVRAAIYYWQDWHPMDKRDAIIP